MKINSINGFTLIEMLGVVVIMTILVAISYISYDRYIEYSRKRAYEESVNNLEIAIDFYIQDNRATMPREDGDSYKLMISKLKELNYLTEDIQNEKNESCMTESYVIIRRDNSKFTYTINMVCGETKNAYKINGEKKTFNLE